MKKKDKCPGCGLANFREADECQWCALALSGRAHVELPREARAQSNAPWGLMLIAFAVLVVCGGVVRHVAQKTAARFDRPAEAEARGQDAESSNRAGGGHEELRKPGAPAELIRKSKERDEEFRRVLEEHERGVYGDEKDPRKLREKQDKQMEEIMRPYRQAPAGTEPRPNPYHVPARPRDASGSW